LKRIAVRRDFGHINECDYSGGQIKNEMGWVCGMYGAKEMCLLDFYGDTRGKESTCNT